MSTAPPYSPTDPWEDLNLLEDRGSVARALPELVELEWLIRLGRGTLRARVETWVETPASRLPVYCLALGSEALDAPAVGYFAGFHGLERIGSLVLLAFLRSLLMRLSWDDALALQLERVRLVFMPLVNPGGMLARTRANPKGIDLMRNAPVEAKDPAAFLVGGHRLGGWMPWYRGPGGLPMEPENQAVCGAVERELLGRPLSFALDCHSGFGVRDRLWFPLASSREPIERLPEIFALKARFEEVYPHHAYLFEPQSRQYLAHGDVWDHLYLGAPPERVFLPFTLEMGSWMWVRKNPAQLFNRLGLFNPVAPHRLQRVLRRHLALLDFLARLAGSGRRWMDGVAPRESLRREALAHWYPRGH